MHATTWTTKPIHVLEKFLAYSEAGASVLTWKKQEETIRGEGIFLYLDGVMGCLGGDMFQNLVST